MTKLAIIEDYIKNEERMEQFAKERARYISLKLLLETIEEDLIWMFAGRACPLYLYLKMRSRIVREGWKDRPGFPLKQKYYNKHKLVMSMSNRQMAKEFKMNKDSVNKFIRELVNNGWLRVSELKVDGPYKNQYIYMFGIWRRENGKVVEDYFNFDF